MRTLHLAPLVVIALQGACLDMPITNLTTDASVEDGAGIQAACLACMNTPADPGPGCHGVAVPCQENEKCKIIIQCGFEHECFQGSRKAFLGCGLPCLSAGGVLTPDDPTLVLASNLFQCLANGACGDLCFSSE